MTEAIKKLVKDYEENGDFTHTPITESQIDEAQSSLNLILPEEYLEFLRIYGHGGIGGVEVIGIGKQGRCSL